MHIQDYISHNLIRLKVTPNASRAKLVEIDGKCKLYIKALPEKGKANAQIITFFKKEYNLIVEIKSGERSRNKVLRIIE